MADTGCYAFASQVLGFQKYEHQIFDRRKKSFKTLLAHWRNFVA